MNKRIFIVISTCFLTIQISQSSWAWDYVGSMTTTLQNYGSERMNRVAILKKMGYSKDQIYRMTNDQMLSAIANGDAGKSSSPALPASVSGNTDYANDLQRDQVADIRSLAAQGDMEAQVSLGAFYRGMRDEVEATKWFALAAERGHQKAQVFMGYRYLYGVGTQNNPVLANFWLRKAASQGDQDARLELLHQAAVQSEETARKSIEVITPSLR